MTDLEFDLLDELYFVTSFSELQENLSMNNGELKVLLQEVIEKGWVKCFKTASEELAFDASDYDQHFAEYFYLATKAGLLAHNRIG